jgi:hypothetical protein
MLYMWYNEWCMFSSVRPPRLWTKATELVSICGLVVRVSGYRSRGPSSIPGATRFFWVVVGLERGPLGHVSTVEELLGRKSSGTGLESQEYGHRDSSRWPRGTLFPQKLALTSLTSGGRSGGLRPQSFYIFILGSKAIFLYPAHQRRCFPQWLGYMDSYNSSVNIHTNADVSCPCA